jgi:acetyltransferase-like isoleucine patch superfamily enzyme
VKDIFERLKNGDPISQLDPDYPKINEVVVKTLQLTNLLNQSGDLEKIRELIGQIIGSKLDQTTTIFPPFYTNFGAFIHLGKHVFINHACSFLDMGGITVEDHVLIGPKVNLITENHPLSPPERRDLVTKPILIKKNAWIGAGSTILPGVTIGENAVVAAGAVVSKDVKANTVVGGVPANFIKYIE